MILTMGEVGNPLKPAERTIRNLPTLIDRAVFPGFQGGPHMNNIAAKAVAFGEALRPSFKSYARQTLRNAKVLAEELMNLGCKLVTNGTSNHLMVVDCVRSFGINGKEIEQTIDRVGITASKSTIPDDPLPPYTPSGLRLGTPAMTTRGVKEKEMRQIARWIVEASNSRNDEKKLRKIRQDVSDFSLKFPIPLPTLSK